MTRIVWTSIARKSRQSIIDYIARENPKAALDLGERIMARIRLLVTSPLQARPGRVEGTRELLVAGTPYLVIYAVEGETVTILNVLHTRQKWPSDS